jgi:ribosome-associated toxin RatA of RatAB toxin-antitoxin module
MPTLEHSIEIRADTLALFRLTQDYDHRLDWDPFLKEARLVGDAKEAGMGVRAWCVAHNGLGMETEYISFNPPKVVAMKMTKGPAIFASFAGSWRFQDQGDGITKVIFRYSVAGNPRWMGFVFDPILRWIFNREVAKRLEGLKQAAEQTDLLKRLAAEYA